MLERERTREEPGFNGYNLVIMSQSTYSFIMPTTSVKLTRSNIMNCRHEFQNTNGLERKYQEASTRSVKSLVIGMNSIDAQAKVPCNINLSMYS